MKNPDTTPWAVVLALGFAVLAHAAAPPAPNPPTLAGSSAAVKVKSEEVTDEMIALAVENEMLRSEAVEGHGIDVTVDHGIVTLSGRISNLLARQIAAGLAQRVRGVQSVINQMEVNVTRRDDSGLEKDLEAALRADPATQRLNVQAKVKYGEVTLTGTVPSSGLKSLAGQVASGVKGVFKLDNAVTVAPGRKPTDAELQTEIAGLLKFSALLDDADFTVTVNRGQAVLNGTVGSSFQKSLAADLAAAAGAASVDNRGIKVSWRDANPALRARRYESATDDQVREAILRAFKYDPRLLSYSPKATVEKGVVTLTGDVSYDLAKEVAGRDARHTIGVQRVQNNLRVRWAEKPPTDEQIADFARAALKRDAYVERHNIIIECSAAHVHLYGLVDTEFEKEHAEWTARSQNGVVHVANYLAVRQQWVPKSDALILADLKDKLAFGFADERNQVTATVDDGVAILRGQVDTWLMWQTAMDLALAAGARRPHNLIEVRYGEPSAPQFYGPHYFISQ